MCDFITKHLYKILKRFNLIILIWLSGPLLCFGQFTLSGKIFSAGDGKPLVKATVFLSNASVGTTTLDDGTYRLANVRPGQYDFVVSTVGFETYHKNVLVNGDLNLQDISLTPKVMMLDEVKIKSHDTWERDFQTFKRLFLGNSESAASCKIINPDVLNLDFDASTRVFKASSADFIEIENDALGYNIKYLLSELNYDAVSGMNYYEGTSTFKELDGSQAQKRKWKKNRLKAYLGSSMHFLRSSIGNTLEDEGFQVLKVVKKKVPDNHTGTEQKKFSLLLYPAPLAMTNFIKTTDVTGEFALGFKDCLYVMYKKKKSKVTDTTASRVIKAVDYINDPLVTIIDFDEAYAFFDYNGIIINPHAVIFEGEWGKRLVADMLPVDFVPEVLK